MMTEKHKEQQNPPESFLSLRKPSNEEDERFISGISSSYEAAKLRSSSSSKGADDYHSPVKFSWTAFWKTFIYENLPPVFLSPLAAIFLESSLIRAWHVIQNRGLCSVSTKHRPLVNIILSWLVIYPASWLLTIGFLLAVFSDGTMLVNIDKFQIILAYLLLVMRRLIISVKYAYFREEDLDRLCLSAPNWDDDKTNRRLVGQGWLSPTQFPGLIEDEITCSMDENDICLQGIPVELDDDVVSALLNEDSSPLFPAKTNATKENQVASGFFLYNIIKSVYQRNFMSSFRLVIYPCMLAIPATPFLVRAYYDVSLLGVTWAEQIVSIASILGFMLGFQMLFFGLICAIDFERRYQTAKKLGDLVKYPGILVSSIFTTSKNADANTRHIFIDLQKRVNVFGWMNTRKVLRSFGEAFYLRIQAYTSILIFYSLFCIAILNLIVWTEMRHHISTIYVIAAIITIISGISLFAIYKAIKLQSLSAEHRDFIRNQLFIIEEEIWEVKLANVEAERVTDLQSAKALLEQVDELINYRELVYKPTSILGYAANNGIIGSILGLILTGCLVAIQGFVSTGITYDALGWFNF